jgi:hypothetical protein
VQGLIDRFLAVEKISAAILHVALFATLLVGIDISFSGRGVLNNGA